MASDLSRRDLLKSTGIFAAIGAAFRIPEPSQAPAAVPAGELISTLSNYMSQAGTRQLPAAVIEKTKHVRLDTLASMVSGAELPPGKFAIQFARAYKGEKICTVAASNVLCGPIEAALANGMLAHSDETDDSHS